MGRLKVVLLAALLALVCALAACGRSAPAPEGLTTPFDRAKLGTIERDITYCNSGGAPLKMDAYYPQTADGRTSAVVYIHGGGWTVGDKSSGAGLEDVQQELVARGYLVVSINYRLAPQFKFPAHIEDCKCAIRFLRASAAHFNLDPDRIGVWGGSAGGHLAALLGTTDASAGFEGTGGYAPQSSRVQAVVDMFGPTDLPLLFAAGGASIMSDVFGVTDRFSETLKRASPTTHVSPDDPPFLILHGDKDSVVPPRQSQVLEEALQSAGVPVTLVMVENAGHSFTPTGGPITPSRPEIPMMVADFFDCYLR